MSAMNVGGTSGGLPHCVGGQAPFLVVPLYHHPSIYCTVDRGGIGGAPIDAFANSLLDYPVLKAASFGLKEVTFGLKEVTFRLKEVTFGLKEVTFRLKVITFGLKEVTFRLKEVTFRLKEVTFKVKATFFGTPPDEDGNGLNGSGTASTGEEQG
jgi:hypothetical protein